MSKEILLLSGPNLNLLGTRSPEIYGTQTLEDHVASATERAKTAGYSLRHLQTNFEGALIEAVHEARGISAAIVINAGALTHVSWGLADALATFEGPKVEIHLSNPAAREPFRHVSTLARVVSGSIAGFGALSYELGVDAVVSLLNQ
jgi:3-dehydroquinate dehydratase II